MDVGLSTGMTWNRSKLYRWGGQNNFPVVPLPESIPKPLPLSKQQSPYNSRQSLFPSKYFHTPPPPIQDEVSDYHLQMLEREWNNFYIGNNNTPRFHVRNTGKFPTIHQAPFSSPRPHFQTKNIVSSPIKPGCSPIAMNPSQTPRAVLPLSIKASPSPVPIPHRPSRVLFVSKIEKQDGTPLNEAEIAKIFSRVGVVERVIITLNKTGTNFFAIVQMSNVLEANRAIQFIDNTTHSGCKIRVAYSNKVPTPVSQKDNKFMRAIK